MIVTLREIESEYRKQMQLALGESKFPTPELLLELSKGLFDMLKVEDISDADNTDSDMLLYQYGTYNWNDEQGRHFSLDITRQFIKPEEDEPYQLSLQLIYELEPFEGIKSYNCWSYKFSNIDSFMENIKESEGFKSAAKNTPRAFSIHFEQC